MDINLNQIIYFELLDDEFGFNWKLKDLKKLEYHPWKSLLYKFIRLRSIENYTKIICPIKSSDTSQYLEKVCTHLNKIILYVPNLLNDKQVEKFILPIYKYIYSILNKKKTIKDPSWNDSLTNLIHEYGILLLSIGT